MFGAACAAILAPSEACVPGLVRPSQSAVPAGFGGHACAVTMAPSPPACWSPHHDLLTIDAIVSSSSPSSLSRFALGWCSGPPALEKRAVRRQSGIPAQAEMSLAQALRSPHYLILLLERIFFCCSSHSGPIIHKP